MDELVASMAGNEPGKRPDLSLSEIVKPVPRATSARTASPPARIAKGVIERGGELIEGAIDYATGAIPRIAYPTPRGFTVQRVSPKQSPAELGIDEAALAAGAAIAGPPQTRNERAEEAAGTRIAEEAPFLLPGMKVARSLGVPLSIMAPMTLAGSGLGGYAESQIGEETPGMTGPLVGAGVSLVADPFGTASGGVAKKVGQGIVRGIRASRAIEGGTEAARYMARTGLSAETMLDASGELKRRTPDIEAAKTALRRSMDTFGSIDERIAAARAASGEFADEPVGVTTRQVYEAIPSNRGGGSLAQMDEALSSQIDRSTLRARNRADVIDALESRFESVSPVEANYENVLSNYETGRRAAFQNERSAWRAIRSQDQPAFDIGSAKQAAADLSDTAKAEIFQQRDVPQIVRDLVDPETPDVVEFGAFQALRSELLEIVRDGAAYNADKQARSAARHARSLLEDVNRIADDFTDAEVPGMGADWLEARRLTKENRELYDPDSPVVRVLEQGGTQGNLLSGIRTARGRSGKRMTPVDEARRAVRMAEQTPNGLEDLRAVAIDDLWKEGFDPGKTRRPLSVLKTNEDVYREILGNDTYDEVVNILEATRVAVTGRGETAAKAMSVGSGVQDPRAIFSIARMVTLFRWRHLSSSRGWAGTLPKTLDFSG
jgi:hypothetical protein